MGAVSIEEQIVGYSSQGHPTLDPHKLNFCSIACFTGSHQSDSGTSAATPIVAGTIALLKLSLQQKTSKHSLEIQQRY
ncbi:S8 family serine peptidase [Paenibacillus odorifer]|uniref:S8 family serine peptidase n=1 Tax=Paenibacillus TaxID=44249 RepID=UPI00096FD139